MESENQTRFPNARGAKDDFEIGSWPAPRVRLFTRTLLLLVLLQTTVLLPFRFTTTMEERDSYRMLLGMLDGVARGAHFGSPLLYNREVSFGYYALIYGLSSSFGYSPASLIAVMNAVSLFSVVAFVIPFYLIVERLFDRSVAIAACIILAAVPVWWNVGLFGHPIMPAMLLFFTALAALTCGETVRIPLVRRMVVLCTLGLALTFRFDLTLLFPALAAVIWSRYSGLIRRLLETAFYGIGALVLFKAAQFCLPAIQDGPRPESILALLERFHNVSQFSGHMYVIIRAAIIMMGEGFTSLLLALCIPAFLVFIQRRDLSHMLFTIGVILPNVVFWLPNPSPPRHYLPMAPAVAVTAAMTGWWLIARFGRGRVRIPSLFAEAWVYGAGVAAACVGASIAIHHMPGSLGEMKSPFVTRFSQERERVQSSRFAADLISVHSSGRPVIVLCDSNLVTAQMEMLTTGVVAEPHWFQADDGSPFLFHEVQYNGNTFLMLEQSWDPKRIRNALDRQNLYAGDPVMIDPYNSVISYSGPRAKARLTHTDTGERIEFPAS